MSDCIEADADQREGPVSVAITRQSTVPAAGRVRVHPALPQVAWFDNSFHSTQPRVARVFALPRRLFEQGVRRYGFHGLSYEFIARTLPEYAPEAKRVVVAHLGSGASLCALRDGKSIESTHGFSGLDGCR